MEQLLHRRLAGSQEHLPRPFWGVTGLLSVLCGALASNPQSWDSESVLALVFVLLLTNLAWASLWDLALGTDWVRLLAEGWPPARQIPMLTLPYSLPRSPAGRLFRWLGRVIFWWRETVWPAAGWSLIGMLVAAVLAAFLVVILPHRLYPLNIVIVALVGLGVAQRWRKRTLAVGQALVQIGLGWLAGHAAWGDVSLVSVAVALSFVLAAAGAMRAGAGLAGGLRLLNGGLIFVVVLLAVSRQPVAAGVVGLLFFGQLAIQLSLSFADEPVLLARRVWPWLLLSMLVAALAIP